MSQQAVLIKTMLRFWFLETLLNNWNWKCIFSCGTGMTLRLASWYLSFDVVAYQSNLCFLLFFLFDSISGKAVSLCDDTSCPLSVWCVKSSDVVALLMSCVSFLSLFATSITLLFLPYWLAWRQAFYKNRITLRLGKSRIQCTPYTLVYNDIFRFLLLVTHTVEQSLMLTAVAGIKELISPTLRVAAVRRTKPSERTSRGFSLHNRGTPVPHPPSADRKRRRGAPEVPASEKTGHGASEQQPFESERQLFIRKMILFNFLEFGKLFLIFEFTVTCK